MRKREEQPTPDDAVAVWARLVHLRLTLGKQWDTSTHVAAADAYWSIDRRAIPAERKIAEYRAWLEQHAPAATVDAEVEHLAGVARRFGAPIPARRLRVVEPDDSAA
jgi:hypothetical protein